MYAYSLSNLTDHPLCVHDVTVEFPSKRDDAGRVESLEPESGSRAVEVFRSNADIDPRKGAGPARPLPLTIEAGATVMVRFHRYYTFRVDGRAVPLQVGETNLASTLAHLLGMRRSSNAGYQCVAEHHGLPTTARTSAGTSTQSVPNAVMPVGCTLLLLLPPSR